jgi:hypothetical protein
MSPAITMNKAQCLPVIGKRSKKGLTLTATNGSASMSCWKSKHRRPSLSRKSVRKQSSNLSRRFRGSALVMGTKTATWPTDSQMKTCCTAPNSYGDSTWQFRGVHFGNYNDCPSTGTKKTCVILCQTFVVERSIPLKPLTTCRAWELYKGPCQRVSPMPPLPNDYVYYIINSNYQFMWKPTGGLQNSCLHCCPPEIHHPTIVMLSITMYMDHIWSTCLYFKEN